MTESAPRPILHGSNISPYVRKVRVALAFKGIEYDDVQQNPFGAPPEFVPVLGGGRTHLARLVGDPELPRTALPGSPAAARCSGSARAGTLVRGVCRFNGCSCGGGCVLRARGEAQHLQAGDESGDDRRSTESHSAQSPRLPDGVPRR
ncbi:MAG: glutathione S-transferase family protein [Deltaproteobacteria bacterium]|nr:glutathione S-transferase family protein [Deltaproteobacteria bacterium]